MKCAYILLILLVEQVFSQTSVGSNCNIPGKGQGKCTLIIECARALADLRNGIRPQDCGFEGNQPVVCCQASKSDEKCLEYEKATEGLSVFSVVGGEDAGAHEYPHMAALGYGNRDNIQWQCGGTLVSPTFILTAAHCMRHPELGEVKYVRMGDVRLENKKDTAQSFDIIRRIVHPEYRPPAVYNDVGLLELNKPVQYSPYVKPACLHNSPMINYGTDKNGLTIQLTATGWGLTQFAGSAAKALQKVELEIFSGQECRTIYKSNPRRLNQGIVDRTQLCAGGRNVEKDTCQGDSGGPLQISTTGLFRIVGVTSFGKSCGTANIPGVYGRVSHFVSWIESVVWA